MKKTFYIFFISFILFSCSKEDEEVALPFLGKWTLINYKENGQNASYQENKIIWKFNNFDELIVDMDSLSTTANLPVQTSGIYKYVATEEVMSLQGTQYAIRINNDTLSLDHNSLANGTLIQLIKIEE